MTSPLFQSLRNYILDVNSEGKDLFIIVPYIKTEVLKNLLEGVTARTIIITTWKTEDLLTGSSELRLYPFCKSHNITLYVNNSIHLKVYSRSFDDMVVATANISEKGLMPDGNYECAVFVARLSSEDRFYFADIRRNAHHVHDVLYRRLLEWYDNQQKREQGKDLFDEIVIPLEHDDFLISALPMTRSVKMLEEGYTRISKGLPPSDEKEIQDSVFHDLANYRIPLRLPTDEFRNRLKAAFFSHPFIKRIDEFISPEAYFGRIKEWIQTNCTDVPIPSRRELTGNVQVLLEWFVELGDGKYIVDVPGSHSQRIRKAP